MAILLALVLESWQAKKPIVNMVLNDGDRHQYYQRKSKRKKMVRKLFSKNVAYVKGQRNLRRNLLPRIAKEAWIHAKDDMKAPFHMRAKPAMFSKPALNIYFGTNANKLCAKSVKRTAYGFGSGTSTIGLDPKTVRINPFTRDLAEASRVITNIVANTNPQRAKMLKGNSFSFINVKVYYSYKETSGKMEKKSCEWHRDVTYTQTGKPMANNTQVPGTPVAILTFGDEKNLWFRLQRNSGTIDVDSKLHFRQNCGSLIVLDPRDEEPDEEGWHWRHKSDMQTRESITYSFTFRCVQRTEEVTITGNIKRPISNPEKEAKYKDGERDLKTTEYKNKRRDLENRMEIFFYRHS